jgi:hypothetical protein
MATKTIQRKDGPIRVAIRKAIKNRGLSGYRLVKMLDGKVSRTAVYRFLSEDGASTDVATAEKFVEVLGLRMVDSN